jgi:DNA topoisomerase II
MSTSSANDEDKYKKMSHIEHILKLPDTYIGSVDTDEKDMFVYDDESDKIVKRRINIVPGLYKLFDEILVNARDHSVRDNTCTDIRVTINRDTNEITVYNNGCGIDVARHSKYDNVYIPDMIFGELLTSTNYEVKNKTCGGKNGYGAKLVNIYSTKFVVETVDKKRKLYFHIEYKNNMQDKSTPITTKNNKDPYVKISFIPDFNLFNGIDCITDDMYALMKKRVYDMAGCTNKNVSVMFNNNRININSFADYVLLYYTNPINSISVYESVKWWNVCCVYDSESDNGTVSFVNGICTSLNGTHVDHVAKMVVDKLTKYIKNKHKSITIKPAYIKENVTLFVDATIEEPAFNSQVKEQLTTNIKSFAHKCDLSDKFFQLFCKTGIIDEIVNLAQYKDQKKLEKSDGKKKDNLRDVKKLVDAKWAGTRKSAQCRLILTEGLSAKPFAIEGLKILGNERYGVYPLKGKLLNVRDKSVSKIEKNEEIAELKKILGIKQNKIYENNSISQLRYGGIVILTDQDVDGSHIKGLIINAFHYLWPTLIKNVDGFIQTMITPIVKAHRVGDNKMTVFYNLTDYNKWLSNVDNVKKWKIKYYKGLGTTPLAEAKDSFIDFDNVSFTYIWNDTKQIEFDNASINSKVTVCGDTTSIVYDADEECINKKPLHKSMLKPKPKSKKQPLLTDINSDEYSIRLAFDENMTDHRKHLLMNYDHNNILDYNSKYITYHEFVNKDLVHFSNEDIMRSIPSIIDGFKPSQRKVYYVTLSHNLKDTIRVSQLAGYVSAESKYHHGEASLHGTITTMARTFVGSNNINVLFDDGNFGTRTSGGKDVSQPRYIATKINDIYHKLIRSEDNIILKYRYEEGGKIEPYVYYPILPTILINGCDGIGTGFSTKIPCYNPIDIVNNVLRLIHDEPLKDMKPWYRNHLGGIEQLDKVKYSSNGKYAIIGEDTVRITELPIGTWTDPYIEWINETIDSNTKKKIEIITDFDSNADNDIIDITVNFNHGEFQKLQQADKLCDYLKLRKSISISNMHLYNNDEIIQKFNTVHDIIHYFYKIRLDKYDDRKKYYLQVLKNEMLLLQYKTMFIEYKVDNKIIIENKKKDLIQNELIELEFPRLSTKFDAPDDDKSYDYIFSMQIHSLTREKIIELKQKYKDKKDEYEQYKKKHIKVMWEEEINDFVKAYNTWLIYMTDRNKSTFKQKKSSKRR